MNIQDNKKQYFTFTTSIVLPTLFIFYYSEFFDLNNPHESSCRLGYKCYVSLCTRLGSISLDLVTQDYLTKSMINFSQKSSSLLLDLLVCSCITRLPVSSQWPTGPNCTNTVINIGWVRLSLQLWPKVGCGAAKEKLEKQLHNELYVTML